MEKIPTLFERDESFKVVNRPKVECSWVFDGEGVGTEKLDGTNIRLTVRSGQLVRVEKRRNPSKVHKQQGIVPFNLDVPSYVDAPRSYAELQEFLGRLESRYAPGRLAEGIVFHHPEGRRAKIKRKDFPVGR